MDLCVLGGQFLFWVRRLRVADPSPFPETAHLLRSAANREGENESSPTSNVKVFRGQLRWAESLDLLGSATLDCVLLNSVLASLLTSCQPASHAWRFLPIGQLELYLEVRGLSALGLSTFAIHWHA